MQSFDIEFLLLGLGDFTRGMETWLPGNLTTFSTTRVAANSLGAPAWWVSERGACTVKQMAALHSSLKTWNEKYVP